MCKASAVSHLCALLYNHLFKSCMVKRAALPCPNAECDRYFASQKSLDHHRHIHHNDPSLPNSHPFKCSQCPKYFRSETALVQHAEVSHQLAPQIEFCEKEAECDEETGKHLCAGCGKRFPSRSALKMHSDVTHSPNAKTEVHKCPVCSKEFYTPDALCQHQQCVNHLLPHVCVVCFASFRTTEVLEGHYMESNHNHYWLCAECPKKFPEHEALLKHEASTSHSGGFQALKAPVDYTKRRPSDKPQMEFSSRKFLSRKENPNSPRKSWAHGGSEISCWGKAGVNFDNRKAEKESNRKCGGKCSEKNVASAMFTPLKLMPESQSRILDECRVEDYEATKFRILQEDSCTPPRVMFSPVAYPASHSPTAQHSPIPHSPIPQQVPISPHSSVPQHSPVPHHSPISPQPYYESLHPYLPSTPHQHHQHQLHPEPRYVSHIVDQYTHHSPHHPQIPHSPHSHGIHSPQYQKVHDWAPTYQSSQQYYYPATPQHASPPAYSQSSPPMLQSDSQPVGLKQISITRVHQPYANPSPTHVGQSI